MSLTIVGSVALDTITSPHGRVEKAEGGSATYAALAASYFTKPHLVGIVGSDTYERFNKIFKSHGIVTDALIEKDGKTFLWEGEYKHDLNEAVTYSTCLNVFADFDPELPKSYRNNRGLLLGNIAPDLQMSVLKQCKGAKFRAADTMNFWIKGCPDKVLKVVPMVDLLFINHQEAMLLTGEQNIHKAAEALLAHKLKYLVIKKGEFGVNLYSRKELFCLPALPLKTVKDPTGAGDCFAGGFMGYLCEKCSFDFESMKTACFYGTVMASLNIEEFSIGNLLKIQKKEIDKRFKKLLSICDTSGIAR